MAEQVEIKILAKDDASNTVRVVGASLRDLERDAAKARTGFASLRDAAAGVAQGLGFALGNVAVQGVQLLAGALANSVNVAGEFQASIIRFGAVAGDALGQAGYALQDVEQLAFQLGSATAYSAAEAVEALTALVKGGVSVEDAMSGATEATLNLADAAGMELGTAAEIIAKQLGVWGDRGVTAAQTADLLTQAANASTVDVQELALGLANVGGTAKTAGVSFEDLVQTMALIAPNFSSAADAGTSLKTFISRLIPSTKDATDAMIALGLATADGRSVFFDASGQFVGMEEAARLLHAATAGLSEEQKLLAFNTIFGADAIRAAAAIAAAGADGFAAMGNAMQAAGGAAEAAASMQQGYTYALEQLSGAWETLLIVIGQSVLPLLTDIISMTAAGVGALANFASAVLSADDPLATLAAQLGLTSEQTAWLRAAFDLARQEVLNALTALQAGAQAALSALMSAWQQHGDAIMADASMVWSEVQAIVGSALSLVTTLVQTAAQAIVEWWRQHGNTVQTVTAAAWQAIAGVVTGALALIRGVVEAGARLVRGDWSGAMDALQRGAQDAMQRVRDGFAALPAILSSAMQSAGRAVSDAWQAIVAGAAGMGSALIDGIRAGVTRAAQGLARAVADAAWQALQSAKQALGISSPSKVAAAEVGQPLVEGIMHGMRAMTPMLAQTSASIGAQAVAPASAMVTVNAGGITINAAPGQREELIAQRVRDEVNRLARAGLTLRRAG